MVSGYLKRQLLGGVCALVLAGTAAAQSRDFNIAAGDLKGALDAYAKQSGVQLIFDSDSIQGKRTAGVYGALSAEDALKALLSGSGLEVQRDSSGAVAIHAAPHPKPDTAASPAKPQASAPAPAEQEANEIIVSGTHFRLSPAPQDEKEKSVAFVSSVGAIELGQRTDTTVVEALERLPDVAQQRGTFTAQDWYPAIRGIPGWYNSSTIDGGVLYLSTRNQRGTPLDFIPASIVNNIVVYKTVTPDMDPNSIGGHVDVRTLRSFDNDGVPLASLDIQGVNYAQAGTPKSGSPSYNINGVMKDTFGPGGNFGFVLAGSEHEDRYNEIYNGTSGLIQQNGVDIPSGNVQNGNYNSTDRGANVMGKLEGRGADWYGYLASNYFYDRIWRDAYRSNVSIVPSLATGTGDGIGSFTDATPLASPYSYYNDRHIFSIRSGAEYQTNEDSKIVFNASFLNALFHEGVLTGGNINGPTASGTYNISDTTPATTLSGSSALGDPTQWKQAAGTTASQIEYPLYTNIATGRVEYKSNDFDFSHGLGYDFGVDYRQMWRNLDQYQNNFTLPAGTSFNLGQVLASGAPFNGANPLSPIYVDTAKYWNLVEAIGTKKTVVAPTSDYSLNEMVVAPFAAIYYTSDLFRVIAGGRYNLVHYSDSTATALNGVISPFHIARTLPLLLPNVQGDYNIQDNLRVRAAYTETMALQNYSTFASGITTNLDNKGNLYTQGTNPYLKPRHSYNEDLSLEYYLSKGYFSLGYFHKTIVDEVQTITQYNYNSAGVLTSYQQTPINAGGEHTQGIEFESAWRDFTPIAPWLEGFSIDANASWFSSDTEAVVGSGTKRTLPYFVQQPKYIANLILSYNQGPFSASILGHASGKALSTISTAAATDVYIAPEYTLDVKAGYQVNDNLKIYFSGRNLTNSWYKELWGIDENLVSNAIKSGPIYTVGAKMDF